MNQVKQIYQLHQQGVAIKRIAAILHISKNTVRGYLRRINEMGIDVSEVLAIDNPILEEQLKPVSSQEKINYQEFLLRAEYYASELSNRRKTHVTRMLLWEEDYQAGHIHMKYSRFCYHLQRYLKSKHPSLVQQHQPADKIFLDFAGDKLCITDRVTGKEQPVETLLLTLGYSNYTIATCIASQKNEHLAEGFVKAVTQLGGVSAALVPDNMKTAVTMFDRYDPHINESFLDMANYYGMVVLPARPARPKDKAKVEVHVNIVYQQAYARLRHMTFYNLEQLNAALNEKMNILNDAIMQDYGVSRRTLLERDERPLLKALPPSPYQLVRQTKVTVLQNGHIKLSSIKKYLSVPYRLIGQKVTVLLSNGIARIYYQRECVATHIVSGGGLYITKTDHLASAHQDYLASLSPEALKQKARAVGPEVEAVITAVLSKAVHPEHAYKTCQGILALQFKCERRKYLLCCQIAMANDMVSLRYLRHLTGSPYVEQSSDELTKTTLPVHQNLRGAANYQ